MNPVLDALHAAAAALDRVVNSSDLNGAMVDAEEALGQVNAALAAPEAEPRFMYTTVGDDPASDGQFATLAEMLDSNSDDADFCAWLRTAEVGASYKNGGGAAPLFVTWRVS